VVVALLGPQRKDAIRWISLSVSVVTLLLALTVSSRFAAVERSRPQLLLEPRTGVYVPTFRPEFVPGSTPDAPFATSWNVLQIGPGNIQFYIGVDGLNIWLVVLTAVLMLPSVLISWTYITERTNEFYAWLLALQTAMMGIFLSFDIILFYVFFELSLVPLFFLIGIWGGPERRYAARKFFVYTLTGSLITLLGVIGVVLACFYAPVRSGAGRELTFAIPRLVELVHMNLLSVDPAVREQWRGIQMWVFLALMAGFAVKVPLVPFHTWLPLAHVEAPTAGSVDLAGVLLKVGAYGFLRLCVPLAPDVSLAFGLPLVMTLAVIGIVYGAFCAYAQKDMKRLIAYSSVSHLGMCMLGMFTLSVAGIQGSLLMMINHGLSTGALFLLIGMIYERYHTRQIEDYGGMASKMPLFAAFLVFACLTSAALPGLNGFISEVLVLAGVFQHELGEGRWPLLGAIASSGIILGAWYLFTMTRRMLFGTLKEPEHHGHEITDLNLRELAIVVPICALCVLLGVYPQPVLRTAEPDVLTVVDIAQRARHRVEEGRARPQPPAVADARP
jgi:NADH-quinone oxidoreductase subunit M